MSAAMPAIVVLILCKTIIAGPPDKNAKWTGAQNRAWATENAKMVCRRKEVQMHDPATSLGAAPQAFTVNRCNRAGIMLGAQWDAAHPQSPYRFWRVACPTPVMDTQTGRIIAWTLPDCGHRGTVICEGDIEI